MGWAYTNDEVAEKFEGAELTFTYFSNLQFHFQGFDRGSHLYAIIGDGTLEGLRHKDFNNNIYLEDFEGQFDALMITIGGGNCGEEKEEIKFIYKAKTYWEEIRALKHHHYNFIENEIYTIRIVEGIDCETGNDIYSEYMVSWKNGMFNEITTNNKFTIDDVDDILIKNKGI